MLIKLTPLGSKSRTTLQVHSKNVCQTFRPHWLKSCALKVDVIVWEKDHQKTFTTKKYLFVNHFLPWGAIDHRFVELNRRSVPGCRSCHGWFVALDLGDGLVKVGNDFPNVTQNWQKDDSDLERKKRKRMKFAANLIIFHTLTRIIPIHTKACANIHSNTLLSHTHFFPLSLSVFLSLIHKLSLSLTHTPTHTLFYN